MCTEMGDWPAGIHTVSPSLCQTWDQVDGGITNELTRAGVDYLPSIATQFLWHHGYLLLTMLMKLSNTMTINVHLKIVISHCWLCLLEANRAPRLVSILPLANASPTVTLSDALQG